MRFALAAAALLAASAFAALATPAAAITIPVCLGGPGLCNEVVCVTENEYECWADGSYGTCVGTAPNSVVVCSPFIPYPF